MPGSFSFISERRSKQEVVTEALHVLAKIHGGKVELPVKAFVSRWGKDPFARGSYSYLPPGTTGEFDWGKRRKRRGRACIILSSKEEYCRRSDWKERRE